MNYEQVSIYAVWDKLGDGVDIVGVVLDDTEKFDIGVYDLTGLSVNTVLELINADNTVFFMRKGE